MMEWAETGYWNRDHWAGRTKTVIIGKLYKTSVTFTPVQNKCDFHTILIFKRTTFEPMAHIAYKKVFIAADLAMSAIHLLKRDDLNDKSVYAELLQKTFDICSDFDCTNTSTAESWRESCGQSSRTGFTDAEHECIRKLFELLHQTWTDLSEQEFDARHPYFVILTTYLPDGKFDGSTLPRIVQHWLNSEFPGNLNLETIFENDGITFDEDDRFTEEEKQLMNPQETDADVEDYSFRIAKELTFSLYLKFLFSKTISKYSDQNDCALKELQCLKAFFAITNA